MVIAPPLALLAELTHRCPLRCPYCSNPVELVAARQELATAEWADIFRQAAALGCLQVHLSGGEPTARRDILALVRAAAEAGLYTNLITAGLMPEAMPEALAAAGLDHLQLSLQDAEAEAADRIAGSTGAHRRKLATARRVVASGLPLTVNLVVHRQNLDCLPGLIALALELGATRLEVAHAQYHGWALRNRGALLPSRQQLDDAIRIIEAAREALRGRLAIDHVLPDYHARRPKPCMAGWGQRFLAVTPAGRLLPCHAAESLPGLDFPQIRQTTLRAAWEESEAFNRFRGTAWMPPPCRGCPEAERDWGGCRCQAFALTGKAEVTDPVCALSPDHHLLKEALAAIAEDSPGFLPREMPRAG